MIELTGFYRFLSIDVWGGLPPVLQRLVSRIYTTIYNTRWSRHIIEPYCRHHYTDSSYLENFVPESGGDYYQTFQDFFSRKLRSPLMLQANYVWPAEGLLCDYGQVDNMELVSVKGEMKHVRSIFGETAHQIPGGHYFSNIFLHNNNYHRIHAPVSGRIKKIERIRGELVLLRPWVYKNDPSLPALRNERVNIDIEDVQGRTWFLSVVGGPAVGTVDLPDGLQLDMSIETGDELSIFKLGSTCCLASPEAVTKNQLGDMVAVGEAF